ncbi:type 4a pilus biogenesis protein PilO [Romboutsia ilealis]|uniref:type 4a pilus biogenesis protein PilO n=1 Tax=Romboutsia ilealis TaxID=1115758 RepID=UPI0026765593|nr:type 4a pilus biogenesis protein PilO [Romboutsia ilealis]
MNNESMPIEEVKEKKSILQMDVKDLFKSDILKKDVSPKAAFISIAVLCGISLYGYFMVYPKYIEYKSTATNLESVQGELLQYQQRMNEIPALEEQLSALTKEAKIKSQRLSHDMEDGLFLIGLDKMINELEITLKNYKIDEIVDYDKFYAIPMSIDIEGDYRRVRELIYFLEEQKNVTQVMDFSMNTKMTETKKEVSKTVYWTDGDEHYHLDKSCTNIAEGQKISKGTIEKAESAGKTPDSYCIGDIADTIDVEVTSAAKGDISASIKFIVYSSDKDIIKLETDKPENWKPGKYNPFQDTLN